MKTVVSVIGKDAVGILAKVCTACAEANVNVEEVTQRILRGTFAMIMLVELKDCDISFPSLTAQLEAAGVELGMKVHLMHEDIFNAMHRI